MKSLWLALAAACTLSCATGGSTWMAQPLSTGAWDADEPPPATNASDVDPKANQPKRVQSRVLHEPARPSDSPSGNPTQPAVPAPGKPGVSVNGGAPAGAGGGGGRVLGTFRNTYYDFPSESDFNGETVALKNARCKTIKDVARTFYEAVCVQGSGTLQTGSTVSFAKRDCACAPLCPRTDQHICFDELDARAFPWGRGATGRAITPLLSVAVDTDVVPLDTPLYIPEFDGVPRDPSGSANHDGCFIAQDRGVRVKGQHIDVFTGHHELTTLWNSLVPSNRGVTVVLDSPHCARAAMSP